MTNPSSIPAIATLKSQAKRLRAALAADGTPIAHSKALELLARQYGLRDWNTLCARASAAAHMPAVGETVRGRYMGRSFTGTLRGLERVAGGRWRVSVHLDQPVDVVDFASFSALRRRISAVIGPDGVSPRKRSDGTPHLVLDGACA